jgi:hypothetical protein
MATAEGLYRQAVEHREHSPVMWDPAPLKTASPGTHSRPWTRAFGECGLSR